MSANWKSPDRLLIIIIVWFIFPFVILGQFSYTYVGDNFEILVTHLVAMGNNGIHSGDWNFASSSGTDTASTGITGAVNMALFSMLPGWLANQILVVVQTLAALLGSYFVCRKLFKLSKTASLLPPIMFGVMLPGFLYHSVVSLLPLLIISLSSLLDNRKALGAWLFALVTVFWVSGTAYMSWLILFPSAMLIGWYLFVEKRHQPAQWAIIIGAALLLQIFRYDDILALSKLTPYGHLSFVRPLPTLDNVLKWPPLLSSHLNILCAVLFLFAWVTTKPRTSCMRGMAVFMVIGIFAEPLAFLAQIYLVKFIPLIQGFSMLKISTMFNVFLWLSSAFAVEPILERLSRTGYQQFLSRSILAAISIVILYQGLSQKKVQFYDWISQGNYVHNLQSPVIEKIAAETKKSIIPVRAEMFQMYSTYLQPYGIETAGGYEPIYMRRYFEFWGTLLEPWLKSEPDPRFMKIFDEWPYLRPVRHYLTTQTHIPERRFGAIYRLNLLSMVNVGWIFTRDKFTDPELELIHGDFKPWSSLTRREKVKTNLRANFYGREHLFVYKNTTVMPRFISPSQIELFDDGQSTLNALAQSTVDKISDTLFIAKADLPKSLDPNRHYSKITVTPTEYKKNIIKLTTLAGEEGLLIGFNAWSPFWSVEIDGKPAEMFPANHAFWGVIIPSGTREVVFQYKRYH